MSWMLAFVASFLSWTSALLAASPARAEVKDGSWMAGVGAGLGSGGKGLGAGYAPLAATLCKQHVYDALAAGSRLFEAEPGVNLTGFVLRPESRGSVLLAGPDPFAKPLIDFNFLADPRDRDVLYLEYEAYEGMAEMDAMGDANDAAMTTATYPMGRGSV